LIKSPGQPNRAIMISCCIFHTLREARIAVGEGRK
jgi:hypothetical protein